MAGFSPKTDVQAISHVNVVAIDPGHGSSCSFGSGVEARATNIRGIAATGMAALLVASSG